MLAAWPEQRSLQRSQPGVRRGAGLVRIRRGELLDALGEGHRIELHGPLLLGESPDRRSGLLRLQDHPGLDRLEAVHRTWGQRIELSGSNALRGVGQYAFPNSTAGTGLRAIRTSCSRV